MITIKTDKIKDLASKVAMGVDGDRTSPISELLEFELKDKNLTLKTTNKEYFLKAVIENVTDSEEYFHATIIADTFLTLVSKTTTNEIKLDITDSALTFKGNGKYTFPVVLEGDDVVRLPEIPFEKDENSVEFNISGDTLKSILDFNSKELNKEVAVDPIQKYYYFDNEGALTFVEGACINEFKVESNKDFKLLLNERLVQLFKLFAGQQVNTTIVKTETSFEDEEVTYQNKIRFEIPNIQLTAIVPDSDLVNKYPALQVRALANIVYPDQINLSKTNLLESLDRLSIFDKKAGGNKIDLKKCGRINFFNDHMEIESMKDGNIEILSYNNETKCNNDFTSYVSLSDLVKHGNISMADNIVLHFGTGDAIMMQRKNLKQVIPELGDPSEYLSALEG